MSELADSEGAAMTPQNAIYLIQGFCIGALAGVMFGLWLFTGTKKGKP